MTSAMRRICRRRRVHIDRKGGGADARRVAIPVAAVVGTAPGNVPALRGLRELPDFGELHSAPPRLWRLLRKRASRCWRAGIIDSPINDFAISSVLPNVFGSDHIFIVRRRDAGT